MGQDSKIQWTHHTFNPWRGCTKISEGCTHCYAETLSHRNPEVLGEWGPMGTRVIAAESYWREPAKWNRAALAAGERGRVFCASLADIFEDGQTMPAGELDDVSQARRRLFQTIDSTPNLDWLLLTKRPQNVRSLWPDARRRANVWLGATAENQSRFNERCQPLLDCRDLVSVLFLSVEPMLEMVDVRPALGSTNGVGWVIVGGESGKGARQFNPDWARLIRDMCGDAGVPFFMKQMGEATTDRPGLRLKKKGGDLEDIPGDLRVREFPANPTEPHP